VNPNSIIAEMYRTGVQQRGEQFYHLLMHQRIFPEGNQSSRALPLAVQNGLLAPKNKKNKCDLRFLERERGKRNHESDDLAS